MTLANSFFQSKFDAAAETKDGQYILTFQRAKLPMRHEEELGVLQSIDDEMTRTIKTTEDEIVICSESRSALKPFAELQSEVLTEKLIFASNLIRYFERYEPSRLIPVCFPENLFFTSGFQPVFLHYGVKDSLPPLSFEREDVLQQVKAVLAVLLDPSNSFDTYIKFDFAAKTNRFVKDLLHCSSFESLAALVEKERRKEIISEKQSIRVPKTRHRLRSGLLIGSVALLIPLLVLTIYAFVIQLPREDLFQQSHEFFLENQYSDVVSSLNAVDYDKMPKVVRYELAVSYVKNEPLTDEQQQTILNDLTLQSNAHYYQYWIQVGRGDATGALNTARALNDRSLIAYALIKEKSAIQDDLSMNGKQKQERLQSIDAELKKYSDELQKVQSSSGDDQSSQGAVQSTTGDQQTKEQNSTPDQGKSAKDTNKK
ncbi:type VII secretion protein EssB [Sporolactobacillus sp. CPB3-1]|uniref:Type VII secretion protein EssB n=1 Tax=Sporolactobacillus mangiferae TaxID=2940498 RepID=A0ABT0M8P0_9BACL|nr:type VII secretion protein EssB [Sporolactobacillus mangiferae]MCL1631245.1 type VII secretion protein EssB [Sporolactobacillus mangiferae]